MRLKHLNREAPGPKLNADQLLAVPGGSGGSGEPETRAGGWAGGLHIAEGPGPTELPCRPTARARMAEGAGEGEVRRAHQHTRVHKCTHAEHMHTEVHGHAETHRRADAHTETQVHRPRHTHTPFRLCPITSLAPSLEKPSGALHGAGGAHVLECGAAVDTGRVKLHMWTSPRPSPLPLIAH